LPETWTFAVKYVKLCRCCGFLQAKDAYKFDGRIDCNQVFQICQQICYLLYCTLREYANQTEQFKSTFNTPAMADVFLSVVALVKAGIECCRNAQACKDEAARIGKRLTLVVTRANEWKNVLADERMGHFREVVKDVYLCLQAATSSSYNKKLKRAIRSESLLAELRRAAKSLDAAFNDLKTDLQINLQISNLLKDKNKGVSNLLALDQSGHYATIQQQFDEVLKDIHDNAVEVVVSSPKDCIDDALYNEHPAAPAGGRSAVSQQQRQHRTKTFHPSAKELLAISLTPSLLDFSDDSENLLGGGGFADVYCGLYNRKPVAIKRLKINESDVASLSKEQVAHDVECLATEALLTHTCGTHSNIINVIGCITTLNEIDRPVIVMELMHTTLFHALRDRSLSNSLGFSRLLFLLKGIAGALEFLHLQGIVHHDVKPLNVLLNKGLTEAKLADFGESKVKGLHTTKARLGTIMATSSRQGNQIAGTAAYQAPEILSEEVSDTSRVCEMYSFGVTVWECMTKQIPHGGKKESSITVLAMKKKHLPMLVVPSRPRERLSEIEYVCWKALKMIATSCLSRDRTARPNACLVVTLWQDGKYTQKEGPMCVPDLDSSPTNSGVHVDSWLSTAPTTQGSTNQEHAGDVPDYTKRCKAGDTRRKILWGVAITVLVLGIIVLVVFLLSQSSPDQPSPPFNSTTQSNRESSNSPSTSLPTSQPLTTSPPSPPLPIVKTPTSAPVSIPPPTRSPTIAPVSFPPPTLSPTVKLSTGAPVSIPPPTLSPSGAVVSASQLPSGSLPVGLSFQTTRELYDAVDAYVSSSNPSDSTVAATYGYPIGMWDVSRITNFAQVFDAFDRNTTIRTFNEDLSGWDVSAATNMRSMFHGASSFNGDLSTWDVSQVSDMESMFQSARTFNGDISLWNVSRVSDMSNMFRSASVFNSDLAAWDVSSVTDMSYMFQSASEFNSELATWDVSSVTDMSWMFQSAQSFGGNLVSWNVGNVTDMSYMFNAASFFKVSLCSWLTLIPENTIVERMFFGAQSCPNTENTVLPNGPMCFTCNA
jgi:surface protein